MMQKDIVFFWIQWCGKWTQAKIFLNEHPNYKYFEAWNIFRALSSNENIFSDYISSRINKWLLVEDKLVFWLFEASMKILNEWDFVLFDGFPRDLAQKDFFEELWKKNWRDFVCVDFLLSREKAIERIKRRAIDQWRLDDANIESINKRIETFENETLPVVRAFEKEWKMLTVDANQKIENIYAEIKQKLN